MQILRTLVVVVAAAGSIQSSATRSDPVLVTAVHSGDSIQVETIGRVRLAGLAAPAVERGVNALSTSLGRRAKERLTALVLHRWVRLERDSPARGRAVCVLTEDGQFVNAVLVREGLARVTAGRASPARMAELRRAEGEAKEAMRGIWAQSFQTEDQET
jgi:endonuclease YncB( thermonuclease family)